MLRRIAFAMALLSSAPAHAQLARAPATPTAMFTRIAPPPEPAGAIPLYAGVAPGSEATKGAEIWDSMTGSQPVLRNVSRPTITPFLPDPRKASGAAVIVAPGGGFQLLAMQAEGWAVGQWLADHGVAAFVLKYRLNETPEDERAVLPALASKMSHMANKDGQWTGPKEPRATADALQALALVRADATKFKIDPARVGMIGFSAGAIMTMEVALNTDVKARPSFIGYIYGPMTANSVPSDAPPMFAALAMDDPLFGPGGFGIVDSWRKAGRPVELHVYEKGGHGFGMGRPGATTSMLMPEFLAWLQARGLLGRQTLSAPATE